MRHTVETHNLPSRTLARGSRFDDRDGVGVLVLPADVCFAHAPDIVDVAPAGTAQAGASTCRPKTAARINSRHGARRLQYQDQSIWLARGMAGSKVFTQLRFFVTDNDCAIAVASTWLIYTTHSGTQARHIASAEHRRVKMRRTVGIAVAAIVAASAIGFGVKVLLFSSPVGVAQVEAPINAGMNVFQMHLDHPNIKNLPVEDVKDPF
jgi:hypothetical protein